jgi:hypothetical protein
MQSFWVAFGFVTMLLAAMPSTWVKLAKQKRPSPDVSEGLSVFMAAGAFMFVAWGTLQHVPWQFYLLYLMACILQLSTLIGKSMRQGNVLTPQSLPSAQENSTR